MTCSQVLCLDPCTSSRERSSRYCQMVAAAKHHRCVGADGAMGVITPSRLKASTTSSDSAVNIWPACRLGTNQQGSSRADSLKHTAPLPARFLTRHSILLETLCKHKAAKLSTVASFAVAGKHAHNVLNKSTAPDTASVS